MMELKFSKMHALGNDYVIIDEFREEIIPQDKKPGLAEELCKRRFSVGADGLIFLCPSTGEGHIRFRIFNADGSEAEMCGNGIRCFAKYVYEKGILPQKEMHVETLAGIKKLHLRVVKGVVQSIRVNMGTATFHTHEVPMISDDEEFLQKELRVGETSLKMTVLNLGNPHSIIFTDDIHSVPLKELGPIIEHHEAFPERINAHFVRIINRKEVEMITWERGSGMTLACGTGATATAIAGCKLGVLDKNVLVHLPGGNLCINVFHEGDNLGATMEGDAVLVFDGVMRISI